MMSWSEPEDGHCICPCGKHTENKDDMIEHYRVDHPDLWKYVRKMSKFEEEWFRE